MCVPSPHAGSFHQEGTLKARTLPERKRNKMQSTLSTGLLERRWLILTISLIALSTVLFVTGVVIERGGTVSTPTTSHQHARSPAATSPDPDGGHNETPSNSSSQGPARPEQGKVVAETVFGLDLENPWVVGAYVVVWLLLVIALVRLGRIAWGGLLLVAVGAGALDVGEVVRQFAVLVTLAHVTLAVLALLVLVRSMRGRRLSLS